MTDILSLMIFVPLVGMAVLCLIPGSQKTLIKIWANIAAIAGFLVSVPLVLRFNKDLPGFQFVEKFDWIPTLGVKYYMAFTPQAIAQADKVSDLQVVASSGPWKVYEVKNSDIVTARYRSSWNLTAAAANNAVVPNSVRR